MPILLFLTWYLSFGAGFYSSYFVFTPKKYEKMPPRDLIVAFILCTLTWPVVVFMLYWSDEY